MEEYIYRWSIEEIKRRCPWRLPDAKRFATADPPLMFIDVLPVSQPFPCCFTGRYAIICERHRCPRWIWEIRNAYGS